MPPAVTLGWLGAGAVGDGDGADRVAGVLVVQQRAGVTPDPVAVPVELHSGDLVDGAAAAFLADPVIAAGDVEIAMIEQLGENVDGNARVSVPLGVGVPVGVRDSAVLVEFTVAVQQQRRQRGEPLTVRRRQRRDAQRATAVPVGPAGGQQFQLAGRRAGNRSRTRCCWARISAAVAAGMEPPEPVGLVVVVDQDGCTAGFAGQAVQRQLDDIIGAAAGVDEDLDAWWRTAGLVR